MASNAWYCCGSSPAARALRSLKFRYRRMAYRKSASASKLMRSLPGLDISKYDYIVFRCKLSRSGYVCFQCQLERHGPRWSRSLGRSPWRTAPRFCCRTRLNGGKILPKRLLSLHVFVSQPFVKRMRAVAYHVRAQQNNSTSMFPRPVFSLFHQPFAHAMRSVRVIHHEPADLAASLRFHRAHHEDVK